MRSPIKYFGGKGGMFKDILEHFPPQSSYDTYIEPFGGGASILFQKEPSPVEIYNDLEKNVYSLFMVLSDKKKFKIFKEKCDKVYYCRDIVNEFERSIKEDNLDVIERAFRFFVINRQTYNGSGSFSYITNYIRRGMSKSISDMLSAIEKLPEIHSRLSRLVVENTNAMSLITKYNTSNVFFYLDPPYHHSTRTGARYDIDMSDKQQKHLIDILVDIRQAKILLSGYQCDLYNKLCDNGWKRIDFETASWSGKREAKRKIESLWVNYDIVVKIDNVLSKF